MTRLVAIDRLPYDTWRMRSVITVLLLVSAIVLPATASALDLEDSLRSLHVQNPARIEYRVAQSNCMTLSQAIESVRRSTGGKVVSAETRVQGGREVHHIKVLTKNGKVKTHKVNGCRR